VIGPPPGSITAVPAALPPSRRRRLPHWVAALTLAMLGLASSAGPAGAAVPARAAGVTLDTGPGGEAQAFRLFSRAGANALEAPQPWSTLAPAPGRFRLGDVESIVAGVRATPSTRVMLIPAAIETTARAVPRDLRHAAWDSRRMQARYRALIQRLAPHLSRQVRYVSIANEADVYLSAHPGQLAAFVRFARAQIAMLRRRAPWVKVGVTVTYAGLTARQHRVARTLARLGNATIVTYYPLVGGYRVRSARSPRHDIPAMVRLARGRPLVVQEAGYPSAARLHSSPAAQATFVRSVFAAWNRHPAAIPFLSFYTLFDPPGSVCGAAGGSDQLAFFCSLGLRRRSGGAKPAWPAFVAGVRGIR
jgi:hypothetical protein